MANTYLEGTSSEFYPDFLPSTGEREAATVIIGPPRTSSPKFFDDGAGYAIQSIIT